ncbi:unnamed protein product [Acanthoscelides obtectus]|uniref:DNA replication complex GINS protein PSF2 n=1 Tax=Acanthoscelides obtectus TaxID=200917 RepID=A0A9P0JPM5_ACAOB|nr:unnamed protein product [Acanthoscelides obtectus]CAK1621213.1 DNA replication complex GINS protein PSF2 [Acanthoscelides obtectus]
MDTDEVEFLGEKQIITVVPTFNSPVLHLISGDVGPFRAGLPTNVPMWLAVQLKQRQQGKIQAPDWMDIDRLTEMKENEKQSQTFTKMPSDHYMVEAKILLDCASDDIPRADEIRTIIKDIWDIRMSKIRTSVNKLIKNADSYAGLDNLTVMEINSIRPILPHALDQIYRIKASKKLRVPSQNSTTFHTSSRPSTSFSS